MSTALSGFGAAPASLAGPFGAATQFGFEVPQGDPGAIEAAARSARSLAQAMRDQGSALRAAAGVALDADGGWRGQAASAYSDYSGHVVGVIGADAGACEEAAGVLATLSTALAHAQAVTRQALGDCEHYQQELQTQQGIAAQAGTEASTARAQAAAAFHPAQQAALNHQANEAAGRQGAAQSAANAAQTQLGDARTRGQRAYESYQETARTAIGRLESAAGAMRQAPQLAGGPAVPITVTQGDAQLADVMLGAGSLSTMAAALGNPRLLYGLACGPITPATALEFLQGYRDREQVAEIAASDKPLDDSVAGVIPTPVGEFAQGAWDTVRGTGQLVWSGVTNPTKVPSAVANYVAWAVVHPATFTKSMIDWNDWTHGQPFKAAGELAPAIVLAKGLGADTAWTDNAPARPPVVQIAGRFAGQVVPHADTAADALAPLTSHSPAELSAAARVAPAQLMAAAREAPEQAGNATARTVDLLVKGLGGDTPTLSKQVADSMSQLPQDPRIVVRPQAAPRVTYRATAAPTPRIIRRFPRAR